MQKAINQKVDPSFWWLLRKLTELGNDTGTMQAISFLKPLGVDLFCVGKKFLVYNLVSRNLKTKYHRSVLGLFWTLLSPLAVTFIFYFVFKVVLNIQIPHYLAFILSGMLPWSYFSQTLMEGMESVAISLPLISKVPIPIQVFPFVGAVTNLITLSFALPILIGTAILNGVALGPSLVLLPAYLIALFLMAYGLSSCLAVFFILLRDLRHLMGIFMQIWFYGTPILYDEAMIPSKYHWILYANPTGLVFVDIHQIMVKGTWPPITHMMIIGTWVMGILLLATLVHKKLANNLVERI